MTSDDAVLAMRKSVILAIVAFSASTAASGAFSPERRTSSALPRWRRSCPASAAFVALPSSSAPCRGRSASPALAAAPPGGDLPEDDVSGDDDGQSLASDFFKALQDRNIQMEEDDLLEDDDDDEEDEDDDEEEEEINFPQGAINAVTGFDAGGVGDLAGNVTLTNKQVYDELKERVLESAGGFVELVGGADDEDGDDEDGKPKEYKSPTKVPDPELTAGEVVTTVLGALLHNDVPSPNRGVEVLFGYSSPGSAVMSAVRDEGMTAEEYAEFLEDSEYKVLFEHEDVVIDKGDYSFDRKKAFYNARLRVGPGALDFVSVNFILSTQGNEEDDCWLVDSMLIRPEKMRRRRRR